MSLTRLLGKSPSEIKNSSANSLTREFKNKLDDRNRVMPSLEMYNPTVALFVGAAIGLSYAHLRTLK